MKRTYLEGGKICNVHGIKGAFKVESYCDTPEVLARVKKVYLTERDGRMKEYGVRSAHAAGGYVLMELCEIEVREDAFAYKGKTVYLHRDDVPLAPGQVFLADLIGTPVTDADTGVRYGTVSAVDDTPAGRLYTVKTAHGDVLYPGRAPLVVSADAEEGLRIRPIPGFFDDEREETK